MSCSKGLHGRDSDLCGPWEDSEANLGESSFRPLPFPLLLPHNCHDRDKQRNAEEQRLMGWELHSKDSRELASRKLPLNKCSEKDARIQKPTPHISAPTKIGAK